MPILGPVRVEILTSSGSMGAVLTMLVKADMSTGTVEVSVYSKGMLCDRSGGLGVSLWARRGRASRGEEMVRNTFHTASSADMKATSIVRPSVSSADKRRRRAAIKAAGRVKLTDSKNHRPTSFLPNKTVSPLEPAIATPRLSDSGARAGVDSSLDSRGAEHVHIESKDLKLDLKDFSHIVLGEGEGRGGKVLGPHVHATASSITQIEYLGNEQPVSATTHETVGTSSAEGDDDGSDSDIDSLESDDNLSAIDEINKPGVKRNLLMQIEHLSVESSRSAGYEIVRTNVGDRVYSDRALKWTHLPEQLKMQLCIRTPCDDMLLRVKQLIQFTGAFKMKHLYTSIYMFSIYLCMYLS